MSRLQGLRPLILENPFPPVTIPERMTWTSSSVKLFRSCKRKWYWKYVLRLRPRYKSRHLIIGSAFHHCLGEWYTGRRIPMDQIAAPHVATMQKEVDENAAYYDQEELDKLDALIHTFTGMVAGYERVYAKDRNEWRIKRETIEQKFVVDMGDFDYAGKIDLVMQAKGSNLYNLVEHKTASKIPASYVERLPLDTQIRGYIFGANKGLKVSVNRVLYDVVRKCQLRRKTNEDHETFTRRIADDYETRPEFYFFREPLMFSKADVEVLEHELRQTHSEYERLIYPLKNRVISQSESLDVVFGKQENPLDPRSWTPNDANCMQFFQLCPYHPLCTAGLDRGTGKMYEQGDDLNEELADED